MERSILVASACAVSASALTYIACRYLSKEGSVREETSEAHDGTETFLGRYLIQHYGRPDELLPYGFGPVDSLGFPARCARECIKHTEDTAPSIALDIGCSVGRSTFELSKRFNQVVGIDNSGAFIDVSKKLKIYGKLDYTVQTEGSLVSQHTAEVDPDIDRSRVSFCHGDACNLPSDLGQFGCLLASNLIERIPNPYQFLDRLPSLVAPGGTLVITSTYSWREQFTPKNLWLGGYKDAEGKNVFGFDTLKRYLGSNFELVEDKHMPFLIRETAHKNSWGLSHMTIWKRKSSS
ncbi:uncharacterized protein [Montipora capricornis]|uniref:uncharacterized protein n=1 Tax=Montipora capricornis TaxID=246305 RepID=UPI0035F17768